MVDLPSVVLGMVIGAFLVLGFAAVMGGMNRE